MTLSGTASYMAPWEMAHNYRSMQICEHTFVLLSPNLVHHICVPRFGVTKCLFVCLL